MTPFARLYVPEELADAVSGRAWLAAMLEGERALAAAGAAAGVVPADTAAAIADACTVDGFDWDSLLEVASETSSAAIRSANRSIRRIPGPARRCSDRPRAGTSGPR